MEPLERHRADAETRQQAAHDTHIGHVHPKRSDTGRAQALERQRLHLEIGLQAGMPINFGTELQGFAGSMRAFRPGMQHRAAVAQPRHAAAVEEMRIDAGHLRRRVGAKPERAAGQLVDQLERLQVERLARAGEQGLEMLQQRGHDQLVAIAARGVEKKAPQLFDMSRLRRQNIGNLIRQLP